MSGVVVTCEHCGASLPATAMFCGECGTAVAPAARATTTPVDASTGASTGEPHCSQCGAAMRITDIFCAECGHVARAVAEAYLTQTRAIGVRSTPIVRSSESAEAPPEPHADVAVEPVVATAPIVVSAQDSAPAPVQDAAPAQAPARALEPTSTSPESPSEVDAAATSAPVARFVLQFSTGEQAAVTGSGLLGRNPQPEPGERFEHLVVLHDPGRSVSKTHLEFGNDDGAFWVLDRYSGNGSVLRQPEQPPVRCEPGRRYRAARGSRIDIGEQFFVVS